MLEFARSNSRFIGENARWLAGGFLLTMFSSFGQTFFIGLSGNAIRSAFHLSGGAFGGLYMLTTLATLSSAMTLPWLGRPLDLMPGWKVARFTLPALAAACVLIRSEEHTSALQSLMRTSYAVFCLTQKHNTEPYYAFI